jgi:hypothetical protein
MCPNNDEGRDVRGPGAPSLRFGVVALWCLTFFDSGEGVEEDSRSDVHISGFLRPSDPLCERGECFRRSLLLFDYRT